MKLSISELGNLTGMDRRRIRSALADLASTKGPKSAILFESTEALPMLYILPGDGDSLDLTQERARLAHHQANKAALDEQIQAGKFVSVEEAADIIGQDYSNVRAKLLSLPTKLAPQLVGIEEPAQAQALIEAGVYAALEELSADEVYSVEPA